MDNKQLVQLIMDTKDHSIPTQFSRNDAIASIREELVALCGGDTKLTYKKERDGYYNGLFTIIEEVITKTVIEGLPVDNPLMKFVEFRNMADGDIPIFEIKDNQSLVVSTVARGTKGLRRQRLDSGSEITVSLKTYGIKIYEEIDRVLSGRIDILEFIDKVSSAFIDALTTEMCETITAAFDGLATTYKATGSFDDAKMTTLIQHIEAKTGKAATIIGTKTALGKMTGIVGADANSAKEDLYKYGYYGMFHGTPVVSMKNGHKAGTDEFILDDTKLYVIAGDDKFLKVVLEGETTIINDTQSTNNTDLSVEYTALQRRGMAVVMKEQFGVYALA